VSKGTGYGIFWALLMNVTSVLNDVLAKLLGQRLHFVEIAFFRFFFSALTVIMVIPLLYKRANTGVVRSIFQTRHHGYHLLRGILGAFAIALCCYSVNKLPLAENTTILFSDTLFMLPLASIFLNEKIGIKCWIATAFGMFGVLIMYRPMANHLNIYAIIPTFAALLFAVMNIMIKKMVDRKEDDLLMLFYFALYTMILVAPFVPLYWKCPHGWELILLLFLGIGSNLIQLFLFLAYRATRASVISPIRYAELPIAITLGYFFFSQVPDKYALLGALIIISTTYMMSRKGQE
jgi:S-adenosylmethionine uptake transporter